MNKTTTFRITAQSPGFTLTEVMIALALVSLLLVGISRIFTMASSTIGIGQGLSTAIRGQRAIGQALSTDILGTGKEIGKPDQFSGMIPIDTVEGSQARQPCIIISNFRQAAFLTEQDARNDPDYNALSQANLVNPLNIATRSAAIRTIDADGVTIPRYSYGVRNFRVDSFSFFTSGQFSRQTGSQVSPARWQDVNTAAGEASSLFIAPLTSTEAWVWYGHLRIFNGDIAKLDLSAAYGSPGSAQTPGSATAQGITNKNNLYANQFRLGRMQVILKEPEDHDGDESTLPTVVGDDKLAQNFIFRMNGLNSNSTNPPSGWIQPTDSIYFKADGESPTGNTRNRTGRTPLSYGSECQIFVPPPYNPTGAVNDNHVTILSNTLNTSGVRVGLSIEGCRSDVAGVSATRYRERLSALFDAAEVAYADQAVSRKSSAVDYISSWQQPIFSTFNERPWCNPFPAIPFDSKKMSQRSQLLSDNVTSFIVEFAGDFGTQRADGVFTSIVPDGIVDYVAIPRPGGYDRQTRWYGMPRDVDEDGVILGVGAAADDLAKSPDVIPVRDVVWDFLNPVRDPEGNYYAGMPFEKTVTVAPGAGRDYLKDRGSTQDEETAAYVVAWGPQDFDGSYDDNANAYYSGIYDAAGNPARGTLKYRPAMIRVIVDLVDPQGKLAEPMTQEYVYPVRINN